MAKKVWEYHAKLSFTNTNTQITGNVDLLLPDVYEITLDIWGGMHIVMLSTNAQNHEHKQTLKQVFQTVCLLYFT